MPEPSIRIRTATLQDHQLLANLGAQTFRLTFAPDNTAEDMAAYLASAFGPEQQAAELADPGTTFLIAEAQHETVGYARLRLGPAPGCISGDHPIEIVRLYAVTPWLGRGVGAGLMRVCLQHARQRGADVVWLDVWERNLRAIAFYRRWGFNQVGTQAFVLGNDIQNDMLLERRVPSDVVVAQENPTA